MEEKPEDWTYKGSPFLNIGPHVQAEYHKKPIDPNYNGKHPSTQFQIHPLINHDPFNKVKNCKLHYENRYDCPFVTNEGYFVVIKEYRDKYHVLVEFLCSGWQTVVPMNIIKTGAIKYPYHPNRFGFYFGEGSYTKRQHAKIYAAWSDMSIRTQDPEVQKKSKNWQYIGVKIDYRWYNYQNFAAWMDNYLQSLNPELYNDYQIDKDILQWGIEPKIYGPDTCCLVPSIINGALAMQNCGALPLGVNNNGFHYSSGMTKFGKEVYLGTYKTPEEAFLVYKEAKESYIRELADYYYSINAIHKEIRDILYRIDIQPDGSEKLR